MTSDYDEFFEEATGFTPYPYQSRLGEEQFPTVLDVPTGLGKTAAVSLAWMYKRLRNPAETPRRLVYCLPMRSLVEQTYNCLAEWSASTASKFRSVGREPIAVYKLMGGETETEWTAQPQEPAAIVGTQDMLVSRALMRGYGMSRYEWPVHFALLHNDAFWVFDETQLMGVSLETSLQLEAFRESLETAAPASSLWMSATVDEKAFETVDRSRPEGGWPRIQLEKEDRDQTAVQDRLESNKEPTFADTIIPNSTSAENLRSYTEDLADEVVDAHQKHDDLTLVVVNRVNRAQLLFDEIESSLGDAATAPLLLHSRYRQYERNALEAQLTKASESREHRIVVATQVVEAGLDIDSRLMVTELAPWASIVQRVGRCNREGEYESARVLIVEAEDGEKAARPYEPAQLSKARERLENLSSLSPIDLAEVDPPSAKRFNHVLRRSDFLELFDTSSDLGGNDLDVKRFVRDVDETDVLVYWKNWDGEEQPQQIPTPARDEVCRVPCWGDESIRTFLDGGATGWRWDPLDDKWKEADDPRPGQTILLHADTGGYDPDRGWTGDENDDNFDILNLEREPPAGFGDENRDAYQWVKLDDHLGRVADYADELVDDLEETIDLPADDIEPRSLLTDAALWHDVGKAHEAFQAMLKDPTQEEGGPTPPDDPDRLYAKSNHRKGDNDRKYYRHELASALAILHEHGKDDGRSSLDRRNDLLAYLVASHHGRIRMSLRALPGEEPPEDEPDTLVARGIHDGEALPGVDIPGIDAPKTENGARLDLSVMEVGRGSWLERTLSLRDDADIGPFRLAYLEALLRIADRRASDAETGDDTDDQ